MGELKTFGLNRVNSTRNSDCGVLVPRLNASRVGVHAKAEVVPLVGVCMLLTDGWF